MDVGVMKTDSKLEALENVSGAATLAQQFLVALDKDTGMMLSSPVDSTTPKEFMTTPVLSSAQLVPKQSA